MLIGVKYCGGCNPFYDRKAEVDRLERSVKGVRFEPVKSGGRYDKVLLVCGCQRACIRKYSISEKYSISGKQIVSGKYASPQTGAEAYLLKSREDFDRIQDLLKEEEKKQ